MKGARVLSGGEMVGGGGSGIVFRPSLQGAPGRVTKIVYANSKKVDEGAHELSVSRLLLRIDPDEKYGCYVHSLTAVRPPVRASSFWRGLKQADADAITRDFRMNLDTKGLDVLELTDAGTTTLLQAIDGGMPEAARAPAEIARALAHLHAGGVAHGDVSRTNACLRDGRWRLIDFGMSLGREEMAAVSAKFPDIGYAEGTYQKSPSRVWRPCTHPLVLLAGAQRTGEKCDFAPFYETANTGELDIDKSFVAAAGDAAERILRAARARGESWFETICKSFDVIGCVSDGIDALEDVTTREWRATAYDLGRRVALLEADAEDVRRFFEAAPAAAAPPPPPPRRSPPARAVKARRTSPKARRAAVPPVPPPARRGQAKPKAAVGGAGRCVAKTAAGARCARTAAAGGASCWQHAA